MVRRITLESEAQSKVTEKGLLKIAEDVVSGRTPVGRITVADDLVVGLRALILKSGAVSYHASYHLKGERPFLYLGSAKKGDVDYLPLAEAREITKTIKALGDKGVDVRDGLLPRLVRELKRDGIKWRPK
jgi:hypothetical protein